MLTAGRRPRPCHDRHAPDPVGCPRAGEVGGFVFGLNQFNRHFVDSDTYGTDGDTIWRNLTTAPEFDNDPFSVNQLGHPYQGSIYYGIARSAGLSYWESLLYLVGSWRAWSPRRKRALITARAVADQEAVMVCATRPEA